MLAAMRGRSRSLAKRSRTRSATRRASASSVSGSTTANSSPPKRAAVSTARQETCSTSANRHSARLPTTWPWRSLIRFKPSTSRNSTANGRSVRCDRRISPSSTVISCRQLASPGNAAVTASSRNCAAEPSLAHDRETGDQQSGLEQLRPAWGPARARGPQEQDGSHHEVSGRVSQPPRQPDVAVVLPAGEPAEREARDAKGRGHGRADDGREQRESDDVPGVLERPWAVGEPIDEIRGHYPLERVPGRDADRRGERSGRGEIDEKGAHEDGRPDTDAQQQEGREGDPGRGPDG